LSFSGPRSEYEFKNKDGLTALMVAAQFEQIEAIKALRKTKRDYFSTNLPALFFSAQNNELEDVDKYGNTALMLASQYGKFEAVKF
jgi:ankyrin repeat protein